MEGNVPNYKINEKFPHKIMSQLIESSQKDSVDKDRRSSTFLTSRKSYRQFDKSSGQSQQGIMKHTSMPTGKDLLNVGGNLNRSRVASPGIPPFSEAEIEDKPRKTSSISFSNHPMDVRDKGFQGIRDEDKEWTSRVPNLHRAETYTNSSMFINKPHRRSTFQTRMSKLKPLGGVSETASNISSNLKRRPTSLSSKYSQIHSRGQSDFDLLDSDSDTTFSDCSEKDYQMLYFKTYIAKITKYKFVRFLAAICGLSLAGYFISTRLMQFIGRSTTTNRHTKLWRDNKFDKDNHTAITFPAISICHAFGATMDLSLVYHVHWVETILGYVRLELDTRPILWAQLIFACRSYDSYRNTMKSAKAGQSGFSNQQHWAYPSDWKTVHRSGDTDATKVEMADRLFLCPRTWFAIVHDYAEILDQSFVDSFKDPPRPTKCLKYYEGDSANYKDQNNKFKRCIHHVAELNLSNINYNSIPDDVYWRILEAWAWDTFEVLQYKVGVSMHTAPEWLYMLHIRFRCDFRTNAFENNDPYRFINI